MDKVDDISKGDKGLSVHSPVYSVIHSKAEVEPLVCDSASLGFLDRRVPRSDAQREEKWAGDGKGHGHKGGAQDEAETRARGRP